MSNATATDGPDSLRVRAPAKVNWSLEILGRRRDGYHEIRTILQTVTLSDRLTLTPSEDITLKLTGDAGALAGEPLESNLAYRAAVRLARELSGRGRPAGVRIVLDKQVPVAAGLGGGSSDAAAVLRGLRSLWRLPISDDGLASMAAELGSDVPFFLRGGAALASGRGELLEPLPDGRRQRLVLAWPPGESEPEKTATTYAAVRQRHFTDGVAAERLAARLRGGHAVADDEVYNVFEAVLPGLDTLGARCFHKTRAAGFGNIHLAGSGPSFFILLAPDESSDPLLHALEGIGLNSVEVRTLTAAEAVAHENRS